jgi:hypothetical protein
VQIRPLPMRASGAKPQLVIAEHAGKIRGAASCGIAFSAACPTSTRAP